MKLTKIKNKERIYCGGCGKRFNSYNEFKNHICELSNTKEKSPRLTLELLFYTLISV